MKLRSIFAVVVTAALTSLTAGAHHSFPATYHVDQEVTIEGQLVAFLYRNPHAFVHVNVTDESGDTIRWAIEWGGAALLSSQNVTRDTLRPGDFVEIVGNPARNAEDHRLRMRSIHRPADGWTWGGDFD